MITDLLNLIPIKRILKRYHSDKHFSAFYLQDGGKIIWHRYGTIITLLSPYVYGRSIGRIFINHKTAQRDVESSGSGSGINDLYMPCLWMHSIYWIYCRVNTMRPQASLTLKLGFKDTLSLLIK